MLDLAGVDYVSSAGLRVLMLAAKQAKAQKGYLALVERAAARAGDSRDQQVHAHPPDACPPCATRWRRRRRPGWPRSSRAEAAMRVKFWGTRGSIPVATTTAAIRQQAGGRADPGRRPPARHAGAHRGVRRRRAGLRGAPHVTAATRRACSSMPAIRTTCCAISAAACARFGNHALATRRGEPAELSRVHVPHPLGPHHGVPVLHARLHPGQRHHDLRLPRLAGGGHPAPARRAVVPGGVRPAGRRDPVRAPRARSPLRPRRLPGDRQAAAPHRRFLRLSVRARRARRRLLHRLRAQARRSRRHAARSPSSSATPISSSSTRSTRWPTPSRSRRTGATPATWSASSCARWRGPGTSACFTTSRPTTMRRSPRCWPRPGGSRRSRATATPSRSRRPGTEWRSISRP